MTWAQFRLSGYAPDLPAYAVPPEYWSNLVGTIPQDGIQQASVGSFDAISDGTPVTRYEWLCGTRTAASESVVYAGNDYAGPRARVGLLVAGGAPVDITPGGWAATATNNYNDWTGGPMSTGVLVHDSKHQPIWVDPNAATTTVLSATLLFSALRPYKYMAVGVGDLFTAGGRNTVRWSNSAVPGAAPTTFVAAAGNDAGSFDVTAGGMGHLVDGGRCGEDFIIYGENGCHLMTYVGGATVMQSRRLSAETGILARNCWADIGNAHVVLTHDDVVLVTSRGVEKSIATGKVRKTLFASLYNADARQMSCQVWYDRRLGLVYVARPVAAPSGYLTQGWVWEPTSDTWGVATLGNSTQTKIACATMSGITGAGAGGREQAELILGCVGTSLATGALLRNEVNSTPTNNLGSVLIRDQLDMGDPTRRKVLRRVRVIANVPASLQVTVTVGYKDTLDASYTYLSAVSVNLTSSDLAAVLCSGRYFSVEIAYAAGARPAKIIGVDLEYEWAGEW